jgi:hypothetical protein
MLAGLDTVDLAVIPFGVPPPIVMHHAFSIEDEDLVLVETFSAELTLRDPDDIKLYARTFEMLWNAARVGQEAHQLVSRIAHEVPER